MYVSVFLLHFLFHVVYFSVYLSLDLLYTAYLFFLYSVIFKWSLFLEWLYYCFTIFSMQYAPVDPALLATYAAADRYQLVTSQPLATGVPLSAARYAVPAVAGAGVTYAAAGYVISYLSSITCCKGVIPQILDLSIYKKIISLQYWK